MYWGCKVIVDLKPSGFETLTMQIAFEVGSDVVRDTWESLSLADGHELGGTHHYLETAGFTRSGSRYRVQTQLTVKTEGKATMSLFYMPGTVQRIRARRANLNKIGDFFDRIGTECSVFSAAYGFFPTSKFEPIVSLPLLRFRDQQAHFDEIRGIRLSKLDQDEEVENVQIDLTDKDEYHVFAQASYSSALDRSLPSDAVSRLTDLKYHAIREADTTAQEEV